MLLLLCPGCWLLSLCVACYGGCVAISVVAVVIAATNCKEANKRNCIIADEETCKVTLDSNGGACYCDASCTVDCCPDARKYTELATHIHTYVYSSASRSRVVS